MEGLRAGGVGGGLLGGDSFPFAGDGVPGAPCIHMTFGGITGVALVLGASETRAVGGEAGF